MTIPESIGERWLRKNAHRINYDPSLLPDVGDELGNEMVISVNRLKGEYTLAGMGPGQADKTRVIALPRAK